MHTMYVRVTIKLVSTYKLLKRKSILISDYLKNSIHYFQIFILYITNTYEIESNIPVFCDYMYFVDPCDKNLRPNENCHLFCK